LRHAAGGLSSPLIIVTGRKARGILGKRTDVTCEDCYFHKSGLCALMLESPCPTFRSTERGVLVPPKQPQLVPRPVSAFANGVAPA
jgi:hypothetical protein